ncbi:MAG TPA: hypothetical protein VGK29_00570 [Paludibaculum sp.]|jgi:hypothetical protein
MPTDYQEVRRDLESVLTLASDLSIAASSRSVVEWHLEYASHIFLKVYCHANSALRLSPTGLSQAMPGATEVWDLGSTCAVVRALIDTYFAMYYVAVESISSEERDFREASWCFEGEHDRLWMLQRIGSDSPELAGLEAEVGRLRGLVLNHPVYGRLDKEMQRQIRDGKKPFHLSNSALAERSEISVNYYRAVYRYLSSYTHTYPYSVSQLARIRAGDPEALGLFSTALQYCLAFLAVAVLDFWSLFPDLAVSCDPHTQKVLNVWVSIAAEVGVTCPPDSLHL